MTLNWDSILEEQSATSEDSAIPAGTYAVEVASAADKVAQSGNHMIALTCRVIGGPYDGRLLWTNIVFATTNTTAMKFTLRKLNALGVGREWLATENPNAATIAAKVVGAVVNAEVTVREWNGENRNDIQTFKRAEGAAAAKAVAAPSDIPVPVIPASPERPF